MSQPLIIDAAETAASLGYKALRFNWRYVTQGSQRGAGVDAEVRDLKDAIEFIKSASPGIEPLILVGKSLGSIVAANVAVEGSYPAILLTPICRSEAEFKAFYKPTRNDQVMIVGDEDPLCDSEVLFNHVDRSTKVSILKGNHSFDGATEKESIRNRLAVTNLVGYWLESWDR
jgi:alpha/beta superfamily hydrolase